MHNPEIYIFDYVLEHSYTQITDTNNRIENESTDFMKITKDENNCVVNQVKAEV